MLVWTLPESARRGRDFLPPPGRRSVRRRSAGRLGLDRRVELQRAIGDRVHAVVGQRRVAVLVDRVRTEHGGAILRVEQRLDDVLLAAGARTLDRVARYTHV